MQKVSRELLLSQLEAVSPGLSIKAEFEQSHCYVFENHKIRTFNDEVSCEYPSCLNGLEGAVLASPLFNILQKMTDETVQVGIVNDKFCVFNENKKRQAGITCHKEIVLEYHEAGEPTEWVSLHSDFLEGVRLVAECASDDQAAHVYSCVRITPDFVEAMDSWQCARYMVPSPVPKPIYIRKIAIRHIVDLGLEEMSFSTNPGWVFFRSKEDLHLACRMSQDEEFADLTPVLDVKGKFIRFPDGLDSILERAEVLCADDNKYITITLSENKAVIESMNDEGWFKERKKVEYTGPPVSFQISAPLLSKICQKHNKAKVGKRKLGVKLKEFSYATALKVTDKEE